MGLTIPRTISNRVADRSRPRGAFCVSGGERGVDGPSGSTNSSGTNLDSRRLAPERAARRGEPHGWGSQSPGRYLTALLIEAALAGRFAYLAEREVWTGPLVRQIRQERIWTAAGWPRSAQRG